ncbi:MAG: MATE family efflux transporter [Firmicutes bacterium]|nr:MATE family efflux transporter [Bacillota bacterium]
MKRFSQLREAPPERQISTAEPPLFSQKQLISLIIPLVIEQLLAITVGMADTMMVSNVGEVAVSGISLVDTINNLFTTIFIALATGGSVVVAQYIGKREPHNAEEAARQVFLAIVTLSTLIAALSIVFNHSILAFLYRDLDPQVMENAQTYFYISALSYPFLGLYNSGAGIFRSMGNSKVTMYTSLVMNVVNITLNAVLIFGFQMGVAGAAIASLIARATAAAIVLILLRNPKNPVCVRTYALKPKWSFIRHVLHIGVPTGLENGMFQVGKILIAAQVAGFGTAAIAANAVGFSVAAVQIIPGVGIGLAMLTVVGQCIGAGRPEEARAYTWKLLKWIYLSHLALNALIFLGLNVIVRLYGLQNETAAIAKNLMIMYGLGAITIWAPSFSIPNALRAAGDVKFTMVISILSMWLCRVLLSFLLGSFLGWGIYGVWAAMLMDWVFRGIFFIARIRQGKWLEHESV